METKRNLSELLSATNIFDLDSVYGKPLPELAQLMTSIPTFGIHNVKGLGIEKKVIKKRVWYRMVEYKGDVINFLKMLWVHKNDRNAKVVVTKNRIVCLDSNAWVHDESHALEMVAVSDVIAAINNTSEYQVDNGHGKSIQVHVKVPSGIHLDANDVYHLVLKMD